MPPTKLGATAQPAPRAEVAVLFLLQEPPTKVSFSREARRNFFSRNWKISATNSLTKVLLKSVRLEQFFGFGQNFRKSGRPNSGLQPSRRLEQRWLYYFFYRRRPPNSAPQPSRRLEQRWLYYFFYRSRPPNLAAQPSRRLEQRWLYYFFYRRRRPNSAPQPSRRLEQTLRSPAGA